MLDPFDTVRSGVPKTKAVDRLDHDEYEELKISIEAAYMKHASNSRLSQWSASNAINEVKDVWLQTMESALAQSNQFQRVILDEEVTPGSHDLSLIELEEMWFLGLYLPGFYDIFGTFDEGCKWVSNELFPNAVNNAHTRLVEIFRKAKSRAVPMPSSVCLP